MAKLIVQHRVADYDRWHPVFKEHESARLRHGATGYSIGRVAGDPNSVIVVTDFASTAGAQAFTQDPTLPAAMARAGVEGQPQMWLVNEGEKRAY